MTDRSSTAEGRELLAKATPGPLTIETQLLDNIEDEGDEPEVYIVHPATVCDRTVLATMALSAAVPVEQKQADAALIAAAVNDYARHLDMEDALAVEMEKARLMPSTPGLALYAALARVQKYLTEVHQEKNDG